jgi:superfamily II DNA/RNA helicase
VDTVVHYDLPSRTADFAQREGRYNRLSRTEAGVAYLLLDSADVLPMAEPLRILLEKGTLALGLDLHGSDADVGAEDDQ